MEKSQRPESINIYVSKFKWQGPGLIDLTMMRKRIQGIAYCDTVGTGAPVCSLTGSNAG